MDYSRLYYKCSRPELLSYVKPGDNRVLDIGCAEGLLGESLKQKGLAKEVIGIDLCSDAAKVAKLRLDRVICADLETLDFNEAGFGKGTFDYILCGDVLEHLKDPWNILKSLCVLLKSDGHLIASIPNVRYWGVVFPLLCKGEWEYGPHGILDQTHLRFFTRGTAVKLFKQAGLRVELCDSGKPRRRLDKVIRVLTFGMCKELITVQWTIVGVRQESEMT